MSIQHLPTPASALLASLKQLHQHYPHCRTLVIALSGGLDSMLLLHLCHQTQSHWRGLFAGGMRALHVHHGLSANADNWLDFCQSACEDRNVPFQAVRAGHSVQSYRLAGDSLEEAARRARYEVFASHLQADEVLLMAHHQDDQAETVLMNLLRGSGARGLAGMPLHRRLAHSQLWRPFLTPGHGMDRAQLQACAEAEGLSWIDDESNNDIRLSRNYLRHRVMPVLLEEWPGLAASLSRTALLQSESDELLGELASRYLLQYAGAEGDALEESTLDVAELKRESPAMQALVLRYWLHQACDQWPDWQTVQTLRNEVVLAANDAEPLQIWQGREIRRFRERLYLMWPREPHVPAPEGGFVWRPAPDGRLPVMVLPGNGTLRLIQVRQGGMRLPETECHVLYRHFSAYESTGAGENLLSGSFDCALAGRPRRPLKKILQESDLPPWIRGRTPLVFCGDRPAWIAGIGVCEGFQTDAGQPGWAVHWQMPLAEEPE